jgi:hypothetical protein
MVRRACADPPSASVTWQPAVLTPAEEYVWLAKLEDEVGLEVPSPKSKR